MMTKPLAGVGIFLFKVLKKKTFSNKFYACQHLSPPDIILPGPGPAWASRRPLEARRVLLAHLAGAQRAGADGLQGGDLWPLRHGHGQARPAGVRVDPAQDTRRVGVELEVRKKKKKRQDLQCGSLGKISPERRSGSKEWKVINITLLQSEKGHVKRQPIFLIHEKASSHHDCLIGCWLSSMWLFSRPSVLGLNSRGSEERSL